MSVVAVLNEPENRVTITLADLPVIPETGPWPAGPWTLSRTDGLTESVVRGARDRPLTPDAAAVVTDYEYPLSRPFAYVLRYVDAVTGTVTAYSEWIDPPARELPRLSLPITGEGVDLTVVEWPTRSRDGRGTGYTIDDRDEPYVVTGRMGVVSSSVTLRTTDAAGWRTLERLLTRGRIILLRASTPHLDDRYLMVTRYDEQRITNRADDTRRTWRLDVVETSMPAPDVQSVGTTLQDLADAFPGGTLQDIADAFDALYEIAAAQL